MDRGRLRSRIDEVVAMLHMQDFADTKVDQLSTGMRQRAALARTLLHEPPILILDEPTSGLDVPTARVIEEFILQAKRSGKCILYSTHVMEEAEFLCDRIAVINEGRIRITGTMERAQGGYRPRAASRDFPGSAGRQAAQGGHGMNLNIVRTIYGKEMLDMFRDRRSLISMIVVPVVAMPGIFAVIHYFTENLGKKAQQESARIGISANVAQPGVRDALKIAGFELVPKPDARGRSRARPSRPRWRNNAVRHGEDQIVIFVDKTREASTIAGDRIVAALERLKLDQVKGSLRGMGVSERVLNPFTVTSSNVAPEKKMAGFHSGQCAGVCGVAVDVHRRYVSSHRHDRRRERAPYSRAAIGFPREPRGDYPRQDSRHDHGQFSDGAAYHCEPARFHAESGAGAGRPRAAKTGEPGRAGRRDVCAGFGDPAAHGVIRRLGHDRHCPFRPWVQGSAKHADAGGDGGGGSGGGELAAGSRAQRRPGIDSDLQREPVVKGHRTGRVLPLEFSNGLPVEHPIRADRVLDLRADLQDRKRVIPKLTETSK